MLQLVIKTSTRAQAREITDLNAKMTRGLGKLNKVCSKKVLADISSSSRQMPYSKVRQI